MPVLPVILPCIFTDETDDGSEITGGYNVIEPKGVLG